MKGGGNTYGTYFLAVDIGASGGRHILSTIENGKMTFEEVYRFQNGLIVKNGRLCWDTEALFSHVLAGMRRCRDIGKIPSYMAIDTWGVDFVLLDKDDEILGDAVGYRDGRTRGADKKVYEIISEKDLYARTGIQKQIFNTIYQLTAVGETEPSHLKKAETFLMIPDYIGFRLTGIKHQEYTNATTTQLLNAGTKDWDRELISELGFDGKLFKKLHMPGEVLGKLSKEAEREAGYSLTVMHAASHDTASAVLSVPADGENSAYLSSGTWSLIGIENSSPVLTEEARLANFTNEGGYGFRYRFLKNITGLWMIQCLKKECGGRYSFDDFGRMARENATVPFKINVNDGSFLMPKSMAGAVRDHCKRDDMTLGQIAACIYNGLADSYAEALSSIASLTGKVPRTLHVIGGGSRDSYLNLLTAEKCKVPVYAGPAEASAVGNVISQLLGIGYFSSVSEARACVSRSFDIEKTQGESP